jgi:hypothetical protein
MWFLGARFIAAVPFDAHGIDEARKADFPAAGLIATQPGFSL